MVIIMVAKNIAVAEMMVDFIRSMILDTMGKEGMRFFPLIATLFVFILFSNLIGLIPGSYTVTSQIIVTAAFSFLVYGISLVVGFSLHGVKFLGILIPPGTPGWLVPLMIPIEIISQIARPISLAVRLFANMTAGHVMLAVLFGLTISGGSVTGVCRVLSYSGSTSVTAPNSRRPSTVPRWKQSGRPRQRLNRHSFETRRG